MQFEMKRPVYVPEATGDAAMLLRVTQRMLTPYVDLITRPVAQAKPGDVVLETADTADDLLLNWSDVFRRCAALDDQPELEELADVVNEAVQIALDSIEDDENFLTGVAACLAQVYSSDLVVLASDSGEAQYEVLYRALRGEEEYAVLVPTGGEEEDALLILRCLYPEDDEEPSFEDADEAVAADVYTEFLAEFAEEMSGEE